MDKKWIDKKIKEKETKFVTAKGYILSVIDKYILAIDDLKEKAPNDSTLDSIKESFNTTKDEILNYNGKKHYYCTFDISYTMIEETVDELKKLSTEDEANKISDYVDTINNYCSGMNCH